MKKAFLLLLASVFCAALCMGVLAAGNTVYVSDGGTGDGSSATAPLGTLADAYNALGDAGGTIVIVDTFTLTSTFREPAHSGEITITGGTFAVDSIRFALNGATTFENITLQGNEAYLLLIAQFHPIVFGEGITVKGFGDFTQVARGITILGGVQSNSDKYKDESLLDKDTSITIKSGKATVVGFSRSVDKTFTGTANIHIEGGTIYNLYMGCINDGLGGNAKINISGGTFVYSVYSNEKTSKLGGNVDVKITGGDFSASTFETFDGSATADCTSVADVRGLKDYSTVVEKMSGFKKIITDEGEIVPDEKLAIQAAFQYGSFTASDGTVIPYRYYLPEDYATSDKEYPIFLYMHGNGVRGTNNTSQLASYSINTAVYNSDYECIMIAPQCPSAPNEWTINQSTGVNMYPGSEAYAAFLESGEPYPSKYFCAAVELLGTFLNEYRVDTSRVYTGGGSNGSGAVWNLITLYPEVFAAAVPVAGARPEEDYVHAITHRMTDVPIWAFHGDADGTMPVEGTRVMETAVKAAGGNITYTEVVGGTHGNIWKIAADTPGMIDWMFSQTNDSFENTIFKAKGPALPAPENLAWSGNTAMWNAVENAGAYKVTFYVGGAEAKTVFTCDNFYAFDLGAFDDGAYTFTVCAHPQKNAYSISAESAVSPVYGADDDSFGDYNGNGAIDLGDMLLLLKSIVSGVPVANGDINGDGKVNLADIVRLLKRVVE